MTRQTDKICYTLMSEILAGYLWELAEKYGDDGCVLVLTKRKLSGTEVQDITLFRRDAFPGKTVTVFGCKPVEITLEINRKGENYVMSPVGYIGKEKDVCPA
ncbi:hypothetical protein SDC9_93644 [bioreactor metagenome]|uniref:Uncharacterized protein n=1 Tax=bioreactor metagenome TaxID=1076179 RepID=A0A645A1J8_9ZZZZ